MSDSDSDWDAPMPAVHEAVRNLDVDALRRALAAGASIETLDENGWPPLYHACANGGHGSDDNSQGIPGYWNLRVNDRVAMVRALLDAGASVHARCIAHPCDTPLIAAVMNGPFPSNDIVEMLIAAGADVNEADHNDNSVLYSAAMCGRPEAVAVLIAAGADVHKRCGGAFTPLRGAAITGRVRNYDPLLRAGAALPSASNREYLNKIAATPGGFPAYEREHRRRLTAVFTNKFPTLPVEVISHIVLLWGHCGDYLY